MKHLCLAVCFAIVVSATSAAWAEEPDLTKALPEVVEDWQDMRFGMFNCWGPVSLTGLEIGWSRGAPRGGEFLVRKGQGPTPVDVYDNLYKKWQPDKFDAKAWVQVAKDAGMKYMIFLVKHHDGFCLYDSKLTEFKSTGVESAWKVDVMKEVADACHEADLKLIIYYSQPDWHHPDYRAKTHARYIEYLHGQVRELLTNYGRIDGFWFDLGGKPEDWDSVKLFTMMRTLQPHLIINNRCGLPGDFDTPEQRLGGFQLERPWETCMTLGTQWSWKPDDRVKSLKECIDVLVTCAGRNGNLALNTGPMPNGQIESRQIERFRQIGQWLGKYGESIHGTRGGPFFGSGCLCTRKDNTIYVHILKWSSDEVVLPPIDKKIVSHSLLTGGTATVDQTDTGVTISVPTEHRQELDTIVVLKLDGPAAEVAVAAVSSGSLARGRKATASNVFENDKTYAPGHAVDDDPNTRWGCDYGTKSAWLDVDLGEEKTFDRAWISEPYDRVQKFELQAKRGDTWETFHSGTTIGEGLSVKFAPTVAQHVRLNLLETTDGPSIWE
ncbi:MAG: alpha-L-fucosidase, partial [Planctomycetes bacterium]|nr:alpha-L-fucosidase [Planctomycetota bacterium]